MVDVKAIPVGRLRRLAQLARVGTRSGASMLFGQDGKQAAEQATALLGSMRGLAAKIGQMASYVDGFVPAGQQPAFADALQVLQAHAPTSSPEAIQEVIEQELGQPLGQLFADFDTTPLASASIGQVHRASLHDGSVVAVKVQHPGIDEALENDLQNAGLLKHLVSTLAPDQLNVDTLFEEVASRFREELDYEREAKNQQLFAKLFAQRSSIHVPRVFLSHSARRVLTSELVTGMSLEEATTQSVAIRRAYAEQLWYVAFKPVLVDGVFNADPHPGNYLFQPDGGLTCLDFGCVQVLEDDVRANARTTHLAALNQDEQAFTSAVSQLGNTVRGDYGAAFHRYLHGCLDPIFDSPFHVTREFVSGLVQQIFELRRLAMSHRTQMQAVPSGTVLLNRLQFGFMSVVARLDVTADYAAIEREFMTQAGLT